MLIKSSNCLDNSLVEKYFEFIEEGSIFAEISEKTYILACKDINSFANFSENMDFSLEFNPVMQNDFPVIEVNIKFYKNKVLIDSISILISVTNTKELRNLTKFFGEKDCKLIIFCKSSKELKEFMFENSFDKDLITCLGYYKIDIKDIMKNN